jgi:hypothetical protein
MYFRKYAVRIIAFFVGVLLLLSVTVPTTLSAPSANLDPDDLTGVASMNRQRLTGTAFSLGKTLTAAPSKTSTSTSTRTPTQKTNTPTRTPSPTTPSEATTAVALYAQLVLGTVVNVTNSSASPASYIGLLTQLPASSVAHAGAINLAAKNFGAALSNGGAVLSYGSGTVSTDLNNELQNAAFATFTLIVNTSGIPDTATPALGTRLPTNIPNTAPPVFALPTNTPKFDAAGTLTALPTVPKFNSDATLAAIPTLPQFNPAGTSTAAAATARASTLTETSALNLAKINFPTVGRLIFTPMSLTSPGYAWYAKTVLSVINPTTKRLETLNQTTVFYVVQGSGGKSSVTVTVARGSYTNLLKVP